MFSNIFSAIIFSLMCAFIAFVTNDVAITLLFKPSKKKWGFQGLFIRKKNEFAEQTADKIESNFLTSEKISQFFKSDKTNTIINNIISNKVDTLFHKEFSTINELLLNYYSQKQIDSNLNDISIKISEYLTDFLTTKKLADLLLGRICSFIERNKISDVIRPNIIEDLKMIILKNIDDIDLLHFILNDLNKNDLNDKTLSEILGIEIYTNIKEFIVGIIDVIIELSIEYFQSESVKNKIITLLKPKIDNVINNAYESDLAVVGGFIENLYKKIGNYDKTKRNAYIEVNNFYNFALEELKKNETKLIIKNAITNKYHEICSLNIVQIEDKYNFNLYDKLSVIVKVMNENDNFKIILENFISKNIDNIKDVHLSKVFYVKNSYSENLVDIIYKYYLSNEFKTRLVEVINSISIMIKDNLLNYNIGSISRIIPINLQNKTKKCLSEIIISYIEENSFTIIKSLNIKNIIIQSILSLSNEEAENQVRDIADNQLKSLSFFSGILGFILGFLYFTISNINNHFYFNIINQLIFLAIIIFGYLVVLKKII